MRILNSDNIMTVYLNGEIDHHTAAPIRTKIDTELLKNSPDQLILDFSEVSFMDSSGVGLVLGRYKTATSISCKTAVSGLSPRDKRILMMSGMQNKIEFR